MCGSRSRNLPVKEKEKRSQRSIVKAGLLPGRRLYPLHWMKRLLLKRSIIPRTNMALSLRTLQRSPLWEISKRWCRDALHYWKFALATLPCFPSTTVALLLGSSLDTPTALTVARVGEAGLLSFGVACFSQLAKAKRLAYIRSNARL